MLIWGSWLPAKDKEKSTCFTQGKWIGKCTEKNQKSPGCTGLFIEFSNFQLIKELFYSSRCFVIVENFNKIQTV
jgi:hypothetical protein